MEGRGAGWVFKNGAWTGAHTWNMPNLFAQYVPEEKFVFATVESALLWVFCVEQLDASFVLCIGHQLHRVQLDLHGSLWSQKPYLLLLSGKKKDFQQHLQGKSKKKSSLNNWASNQIFITKAGPRKVFPLGQRSKLHRCS